MGDNGRIRRFIHLIAPNAIWDVVKWIGGSSMLTSIWHLCLKEFHRAPVDWSWLLVLFGGGVILTLIGTWRQSLEAPKPAPVGQWKTKQHWKEKYLTENSEKSQLRQLHAEEIRRLETSHAAELSRAQEIREQLRSEKQKALDELRILKEKIALLSPLQAQALDIVRGLVNLRDQAGPTPDLLSQDPAEDHTKIGERLIDHLQALHGWQSALDARFRLHHAKDLEIFRLQMEAETPERSQQASADLWTLEVVPKKKIETPEEIDRLIMALWRLLFYLEGQNLEARIHRTS
jgi:hypothetical protein